MTTMLRLMVVQALFALPAMGTKCEVGKEDLIGTSKYFAVQVCNLFGATCYMNHVNTNESDCATKALKIPHESCALFPIISFVDNDYGDASKLLTGTCNRCKITCNTDGTGCKFDGACVSAQCSLGGNSWAGTAISSYSCIGSSCYSVARNGSITDSSDASIFTEMPVMSLYSTEKTVLLSRTGNFVAVRSASRVGSKNKSGSAFGLVGTFPVPWDSTTQAGPTACPSGNKLMSEANVTADQLRTCSVGLAGGRKYMYAGAANLLADVQDLNGYVTSRRRRSGANSGTRRRVWSTIDGQVLHGNARRRRTSLPFMSGVLQRYTRMDTIPTCYQYNLAKGNEGPTASWDKSTAVMKSEAFAPNSMFSGELAGTYRSYVVVFYCTDYARKDLATCASDKGAVFYVADPSPALHFGKTAGAIAIKVEDCKSGEEVESTGTTGTSGATSGTTSGTTGTTQAPLKDLLLQGALTLTVIDADALLIDTVVKAAIKAGIAKLLSVTTSQVVLVITKVRRLAAGDTKERKLAGTSVLVNYIVTVPASSGAASQSTVKALLTNATPSALTTEIQAEVTLAKGPDYIVSVTGKTPVSSSYATPAVVPDLSSGVGCTQMAAATSMLVSMMLAPF